MTPGGFYRPQLDVVRFCAFLAVFGHHTLPRTGEHAIWLTTATDAMGFGLSLFFVLSAYLITLLLLREQEQTGSIHLKATQAWMCRCGSAALCSSKCSQRASCWRSLTASLPAGTQLSVRS